jgi:hypothetical protein
MILTALVDQIAYRVHQPGWAFDPISGEDFLAVMIWGTSSSRADSFPGWPNACRWCSPSDLSLWMDGADQQGSFVT